MKQKDIIYQIVIYPKKIHYIDRNGSLELIKDKFDFIFSAHVIEHVSDFILHILQCQKILKESGKYCIIVPDYRYCFDHFRTPTDLFDILEAFYEKNKSVPLRKYLSMHLSKTHNAPIKHWYNEHGEVIITREKIDAVMSQYENRKYDTGYTHSWCFSPTNLLAIVNSLYEMDFIKLNVEYIQEAPKNLFEFICILSFSNFDCCTLDDRYPVKNDRVIRTFDIKSIFNKILKQ